MSIPEIVLSSKNYKKAKMKGGLSWMTKKILGNELARFLMGNSFLVVMVNTQTGYIYARITQLNEHGIILVHHSIL